MNKGQSKEEFSRRFFIFKLKLLIINYLQLKAQCYKSSNVKLKLRSMTVLFMIKNFNIKYFLAHSTFFLQRKELKEMWKLFWETIAILQTLNGRSKKCISVIVKHLFTFFFWKTFFTTENKSCKFKLQWQLLWNKRIKQKVFLLNIKKAPNELLNECNSCCSVI